MFLRLAVAFLEYSENLRLIRGEKRGGGLMLLFKETSEFFTISDRASTIIIISAH